MLCFSIISNWNKLISSRNQERNGFAILDGIRVLHLLWAILGHIISIYLSNVGLSDYITAYNFVQDPTYIFPLGAYYVPDVFFWISGFVMSFSLLHELEKKPNFSLKDLFSVFLHRYLRITPVVLFCVFFFWTLMAYLGNGPLWINMDETTWECNDYWYTNILYLINFIPNWTGNGCLGIAWYISVDMQLFIISPFIILIYTKISKRIAWITLLFICLFSIIISFNIAMTYDLNAVMSAVTNGNKYYSHYYNKPYTRLPPYFLGLACAFIIYSYKKYKKTSIIYDNYALYIARLQEKLFTRLTTIGFGLILCNIMIFSLYDSYRFPGENKEYPYWSKMSNYIFIALQRFLYGIGLSMMLLPLLLGHFKGISDFFSGYPWAILSRLSFTIGLINFYVILIGLRSQTEILMLTWHNNIKHSIYYFILSTIFAIPIVLFIEMPIINLEKLVFQRRLTDTKKNQ